MTRTHVLVVTALVFALGLLGAAGWSYYKRTVGLDRADRQTPQQILERIAALDRERTSLVARLESLLAADRRLAELPDAPVRVGVPTALVHDLVARAVKGLIEHLTIDVRDVRLHRTGTVRRVVTLGQYDLQVNVTRVRARLTAGTPTMTFAPSRIALALPVTLGGSGRADVDFTWDGRSVGGVVCGDIKVTRSVTGNVVRRTYPLSGAVRLSSTATEIIAQPQLPRLRVHIDVAPSEDAWATLQSLLDERRGLCGYVLDRVDVMGVVRRQIAKGFDIRVPTERAKPVTLPVGIDPTMVVNGQPVALAIRVGELSIRDDMIWLGAFVSVDVGGAPARGTRPSGVTRSSS